MRLLEFGKEASLASIIEAIKAVPDTDVTLKVPEDTAWLKNPVNEKILRKSVQSFGKTIHFEGRPTPQVQPIVTPQDVEPTPDPTPEPESTTPRETTDLEKDEAGFVVGGDVLAEKGAEISEAIKEPVSSLTAEPATAAISSSLGAKPVDRRKQVMRFLLGKWPLGVIGVALLLLAAGAYAFYALPTADVKILVEERPLEREATLTASTSVDKVDVDARKLPAQQMISTQSGSLKAQTTGKKNVGTPAKGAVTLYNGTDFDKSFQAGQKVTAVINSQTLKFTLDQAVNVPKRSGNLILGYKSGSVDASVTAADIGSQYNVPGNTSFSIDGFDSTTYQGQNTSALTGGSSRSVQVVAQSDFDKLLSDLTSQLKDKAKTDITSKGGSDQKVIDDALKTSVVSKDYDHKVGEETSDINLSLSLSVSATSYSDKDLKDMLSQTLQQAAPDGYEVDLNSASTSADLLNVEKNGDLTFTGHIKANLIPKFDHAQLSKSLAGKKPGAADSYLKDIPSVVSYNVVFWPNIPAVIQSFPRDTNRIKIDVTVKK